MCCNSYQFIDAPEHLEISNTFVSIEENEVIEPIFCSGEGVPEPSVVWKFNDQEVTSENTLDFSDPIKRWVNWSRKEKYNNCVI